MARAIVSTIIPDVVASVATYVREGGNPATRRLCKHAPTKATSPWSVGVARTRASTRSIAWSIDATKVSQPRFRFPAKIQANSSVENSLLSHRRLRVVVEGQQVSPRSRAPRVAASDGIEFVASPNQLQFQNESFLSFSFFFFSPLASKWNFYYSDWILDAHIFGRFWVCRSVLK